MVNQSTFDELRRENASAAIDIEKMSGTIRLMKITDWIKKERGRSAALAKHLGITPGRMSFMAGTGVIPSKLMRQIVYFTRGEVSLEDMVPPSTFMESPKNEETFNHPDCRLVIGGVAVRGTFPRRVPIR